MPPDDIDNIDIPSLDLDGPSLITIAPANSLLHAGNLGLTPSEQQEFDAYQTSNEILGPAAGSVLICPGNQVGTPVDSRCPYYAKCPLRRMGKAPQDKLCPVERRIVEDRFSSWCKELNEDPMHLSETDRSVVADLVWIDVQVQRCVNILSVGEDARLMHTNVTEAMLLDPEDAPIPITFEKVLHIATQRLDQLLIQRRMLLKEWMLTPEQKFKVAKEAGLLRVNDEGDVSVDLSNKADMLRKIKRPIDL
jgi:hypothetical protein